MPGVGDRLMRISTSNASALTCCASIQIRLKEVDDCLRGAGITWRRSSPRCRLVRVQDSLRRRVADVVLVLQIPIDRPVRSHNP